MKDEWKSAYLKFGGQCVMIRGQLLMLMWHADKLDSPDLVRSSEVHIAAECEIYPCVSLLQMP